MFTFVVIVDHHYGSKTLQSRLPSQTFTRPLITGILAMEL